MIKSSKLCFYKLAKDDYDFYKSIYTNENLLQFVCEKLNEGTVIKCFNQSLVQSTKIKPKHLLYVIRSKGNNSPIGVIGLRWNQVKNNVAEIGIIITRKHQRKGYAHEAKSCLIEYSFMHLNINEIVAECDEKNAAANMANLKLGFKKIKSFINKKNNKLSIRWRIKKGNKYGK